MKTKPETVRPSISNVCFLTGGTHSGTESRVLPPLPHGSAASENGIHPLISPPHLPAHPPQTPHLRSYRASPRPTNALASHHVALSAHDGVSPYARSAAVRVRMRSRDVSCVVVLTPFGYATPRGSLAHELPPTGRVYYGPICSSLGMMTMR